MASSSRIWQQRLRRFSHPVVWAAVIGLGLMIVVEHLRPTRIGSDPLSSPTPSQSGSASPPSPTRLMPLGEAAPVPRLAGTDTDPSQALPWLESADADLPERLQPVQNRPEAQGIQSPFADYLERRQFRVGPMDPTSQPPETATPSPFAAPPSHRFVGTVSGPQHRNTPRPSAPQPDTESFAGSRRQPVLPSSSRITGYTQPPSLNQLSPRSGTDSLGPTVPASRVHPDVPTDSQRPPRSMGIDRLPTPQPPDSSVDPATVPVDSVPFTAPRAPGTYTGGGHIDTLSHPNEDW